MSAKIDGTPLEPHLQKICKSFITLEANEKRVFTQHFNKVYTHVTDSMGQSDDFFKYIFKGQQLAGSYADCIKVGQPNEYDALMILKMPDPVVEKSKRGFVTINIKNGLKKWSHIDERKYKDLLDDNGYLLQDKVLVWLRNLIYQNLKKSSDLIIIGNNEYSVQTSPNGPAVTLDITIRKSEDGNKGKFSIDFVSALAFDFKDKWFADRQPPFLTSKNWNAVAKPNKTIPNKNRDWACSYADIEREYLKDKQTLKQLIRIFKKIRDKHNLTNLKSYFIKVIFLHQRENQRDDYWKQALGVLFLAMFNVILEKLKKRELISFWHKKYNLFGEFKDQQITDIYNKLKKVKEDIEKNLQNKNPEFILSVILSKSESEAMSSNSANSAVASQGSCKLQSGNNLSSNKNVVKSAVSNQGNSRAQPENKSCTISEQILAMSLKKR